MLNIEEVRYMHMTWKFQLITLGLIFSRISKGPIFLAARLLYSPTRKQSLVKIIQTKSPISNSATRRFLSATCLYLAEVSCKCLAIAVQKFLNLCD